MHTLLNSLPAAFEALLVLLGRSNGAEDSSILEGTMRDFESLFGVSIDVCELPPMGVVMTTYDIPAVFETCLCFS